MDGVAGFLAIGLASVLLTAAWGKADAWRDWLAAVPGLLGLRGKSITLIVATGIPAVEAAVAGALLFSPRAGALTALALFCALCFGVLALARTRSGAECHCFGVAAPSFIGVRLAARNASLAIGAATLAWITLGQRRVERVGWPGLMIALIAGVVVLQLDQLRQSSTRSRREPSSER